MLYGWSYLNQWAASEMEDVVGNPCATADAVIYAVEQGWIELEGFHSVSLPEEGRRMMAKEAN
jgi:hypothetical protein